MRFATRRHGVAAEKAATHRANFGGDHLRVDDIRNISVYDVPLVDLDWVSFPCRDLSEAGGRSGLDGEQSAAFWPYAKLLGARARQGRGPRLVVAENVTGLVNGRGGKDLIAIVEALAGFGYVVGAAVIDATYFVPQSRQRVFIVAVRSDLAIPALLISDRPTAWCSTKSLIKALFRAVWWPNLPKPVAIPVTLEACFDASVSGWASMQLRTLASRSEVAA
jgi:DNA (cytosine-5)-methyltransferase 1